MYTSPGFYQSPYTQPTSAPSAYESTDAGEKARRDAILLTAHSADLDKVPTLAEVEDALGAVVVNTPEERERANRVKTWAEILR